MRQRVFTGMIALMVTLSAHADDQAAPITQ